MLIITPKTPTTSIDEPLKKGFNEVKLKSKCCNKYKKNNRCKRCPCFDLVQKAS